MKYIPLKCGCGKTLFTKFSRYRGQDILICPSDCETIVIPAKDEAIMQYLFDGYVNAVGDVLGLPDELTVEECLMDFWDLLKDRQELKRYSCLWMKEVSTIVNQTKHVLLSVLNKALL